MPEEDDLSKTIYIDAINIASEDGTITPEELENARKLATLEAKRRKEAYLKEKAKRDATLRGQFRIQWNNHKPKIVAGAFVFATGIVMKVSIALTSEWDELIDKLFGG
jgi:hypothetical protein